MITNKLIYQGYKADKEKKNRQINKIKKSKIKALLTNSKGLE